MLISLLGMSRKLNGRKALNWTLTESRLIDSGGDWDRRNRLKAYNGIYLLSIRSFAPAAELLLDVLSTFTSTELMEFEDVVMYAVLAGTISLSRVDLKEKVVQPKTLLDAGHRFS
jgi:26S proteasome regulatory subunit N7